MIRGISEDILKRVYEFSDMTNEELRCKFFQKLQECIELCNNTSDIIDWIKNVGLPKEVKDLLTIWLEDGTLEELINIDILNKKVDKEVFDTTTENINNNIATINKQLDKNKKKTNKVNKINEIIYKIKTGEYQKIRFIGDSIGLGADATGYGENPDGIITFNWYGDIHREPKRDVLSYVNLFRLCLQRLNPSTSLINSSISGRSIKEATQLRTGYIFNESGEDVVFIALSINDLHMCRTIQEYEESYQIFIDYICAKHYPGHLGEKNQ